MPPLTLVENRGRYHVEDLMGVLKPLRERLDALDVYYIPEGSRWGLRDPTPARQARFKALLDAVNAGEPIPVEPVPVANPKFVELAEANGFLYVSGPRHLMIEQVNTRLKSQGFTFDDTTTLWRIPVDALTPLKRRNLEKLVAPFTVGGKGDLQPPRERISDEIRDRHARGLGLDVPYEHKDEAKALGGLWDPGPKQWCLPTQEAYDTVKGLIANAPREVLKRELARRVNERLAVEIPYEYKEEAKLRGGLWEPELKRWYLPTVAAVAETLEAVRAHQTAVAAATSARAEVARSRAESEAAQLGLKTYRTTGREQGDHLAAGATFRDRKSGQIMTVVGVSSTYYREDGLSFGLTEDSGWLHVLKAKPTTDPEERQRVVAREVKTALRADALSRRSRIVELVTANGEFPPGPLAYPSGERFLLAGAAVAPYGGGDWFLVGDLHVWYVRNNGADGDSWAANNLPGAMGWRVARTAVLEEELRELDAIVGER